MVARKEVPSLQLLCLRYISSNIGIWCNKDNQVDVSSNVIARLPSILLDDIFTHVTREKNVRPHYINPLIHKYTRQLEFPPRMLDDDIVEHGVELIISNNCTNLTRLNISYSHVDICDLRKLPESIPAIECLYLRHTNTDDDVLHFLGSNCPNIRILDVRGTRITNYGLRYLLRENIDGVLEDRKCHLLSKLLVSGTEVTDEGAEIAITYLPNLRYFDYGGILTVIEKIYKNDVNGRNLEKIEYVKHYISPITKSMVDAVIRLCPNLTNLDVVATPASIDWILRLLSLRLVKLLALRCSIQHMYDITYNQITPTLKLIGSNLKELSLDSIRAVNLWDVGISCPQLTKLALIRNKNYSSLIPGDVSIAKYLFRELREMIVKTEKRSDIPQDQLQMLLTNCRHLQVLNLSECQSLTKELLLRVFDCNSFPELHTLFLHKCDKIYVSSVLEWLRISESIKRIICCGCFLILDTRLARLQAEIREDNLDVTLSYDCQSYYDHDSFI